jgi:hypothetical protein
MRCLQINFFKNMDLEFRLLHHKKMMILFEYYCLQSLNINAEYMHINSFKYTYRI